MGRVGAIFVRLFDRIITRNLAKPIAAYKSKAYRNVLFKEMASGALKVAGVVELIDIIGGVLGGSKPKERTDGEIKAILASAGVTADTTIAQLTEVQAEAIVKRFAAAGDYGSMAAFLAAWAEVVTELSHSGVDVTIPRATTGGASGGSSNLKTTMRQLRTLSELTGVRIARMPEFVAAMSGVIKASQDDISQVVELVEMGDR